MANWYDYITIDGHSYHVKVKTGIKRTADVLDKYAKRTENGTLRREIIGVYFNYSNINFEAQKESNYNDYESLYNKLTEATEFHTITIGGTSFSAYIHSVSDEIYYYDETTNKSYHKNLTCSFTAQSPTNT